MNKFNLSINKNALSNLLVNFSTKILNTNVGFIGVGNMGGYMALNLARSNFKVHVYDKSEQRLLELLNKSNSSETSQFVKMNSLQEMALVKDLPVIFTMLPSSPQLIEVLGLDSGKKGLVSAVAPNTLFIDCTTGEPKIATQLADYIAKHNCNYVDAPVSGGVPAAQNASLTFMVGGTKENFNLASTYLQHMGKQSFHCGPVGTGLAAKLCNNMLLAISMIGTAETMIMGKNLGLDLRLLTDIINISSGQCWSSKSYNPVPKMLSNVPASNNYEGGFGTNLMTKDLDLAMKASEIVKNQLNMGMAAYQLYSEMCDKGYSTKDFSSVYDYLLKK